MSFTENDLQAIFTNAKKSDILLYTKPLNEYLTKYGMTSKEELSMFLAQIGHESGELMYTKENLNYSADGLRKVFGKYFPTLQLATAYAHQPIKIANKVYANRMGNGDEKSGDGWTFRGKGLIQLTGRANVTKFAKWLNISVQDASNMLENVDGAILGAIWFWKENNLKKYVDNHDFIGLTKAINGGVNGLTHRQELYNRAIKIIK